MQFQATYGTRIEPVVIEIEAATQALAMEEAKGRETDNLPLIALNPLGSFE